MKCNRTKAILILFFAAIAAGSLAACSLWQRNSGDRITLSGNIELTQVNIAFKTSGRLIQLAIEEGTEVKKGDLLARLDALQLQRQRQRDAASVTLAETQLTQQKTGIEYQKASLAADLDGRQAALKQAEVRLGQLLAGSRKQEIEQARAAAEEARTQHTLAEQDWERAQILYKNDDISTSQRDQYKTRFDATTASSKRAEEQLALVVEGPRKEDIDAARAQVEQAKASLRWAEATRIELRRKEQEIDSRRAQIELARAQLAITEAQLDDTLVLSPINGVVLVKSAEVARYWRRVQLSRPSAKWTDPGCAGTSTKRTWAA
jgi:HlyD family secretion protein